MAGERRAEASYSDVSNSELKDKLLSRYERRKSIADPERNNSLISSSHEERGKLPSKKVFKHLYTLINFDDPAIVYCDGRERNETIWERLTLD